MILFFSQCPHVIFVSNLTMLIHYILFGEMNTCALFMLLPWGFDIQSLHFVKVLSGP